MTTPPAVIPASTARVPVHASALGAYVLPGRVPDPRPALAQARAAEELGLGTVWLSERWGTKDFAVLAGALGQVTSTTRIASGITHFSVRHPAVLASMAMTAQGLTGGRLVLGFGRSVAAMWKAVGLPPVTNRLLADSADILRRLCRGDKVSYHGPAGNFPAMRLSDLPDAPPPPLVLAAIGPKTLALAGTHFDGVLLHPFLTPEAVARSVATVRGAAADAGRDPASIRVYATVITASGLPTDEEAAVVGGRAVTYFQIPGFGEQLAGANGWDTAPLEKLRAHPQLNGIKGSADFVRTRDQLTEAASVLPAEWLGSAAAVGTPAHCVERFGDYLAAGADELVLHGSTPDQLPAVIGALRG
ncbi:TIGR03857 family LLM class F420-dependent oxidoreductase [Amycolatopsis acidiphila]|uniref:TIGR03857 family LLM class F420-dependent oxidoreductase n=1 Tax=Amycolatopsis acidiphila TaxID=715473 RepID=A0A558AP36_9PSEU|nr:TIGR03857 family LLM class F420-dependent oxidoreductase [Amycolatopsis acidiphila]TVT26043.1 TIGR03857 family LLM class F420-dependent oxidoreductase [Amycolatopsis acidiphila]UIJ63237.1 TIGR03857 family LLM class F420-dependent oxidoreductase [Amycolatopsis acidiphila]GHG74529.1 LLM class F420-dependent oxidoreductase [Amycolatopsis acidiphila]